MILGGREYRLASEPLGQYFTEANPKPDLPSVISSSGCWRGYRGTWDIEGSWLRLIGITEFLSEKDLWQFFMKDREAPVIADWYTGVLRIEHGELLHYVHAAYLSVYERDEYVVVVRGEVKSRFEVTNDPMAHRWLPRVPASTERAVSDNCVSTPSVSDEGGPAWLDTLGLHMKQRRKKTALGTIHVRGVFLGDRIFLPGNGLESASQIKLDLHDGAILPGVGAWVEAEVTLTQMGRGKLGQFRVLRDDEFLDRRGIVPVPKPISSR